MGATPDIPEEERDPTLHEFATEWLQRHRRDLDGSTIRDYTHTLSRYILPEFSQRRLSEISYMSVTRWRDRLRQESDNLQMARRNGIDVVDRNGDIKRTFGPRTINEAIRLLGQILDRAVESEHYAIDRNPAKGRSGLRVKTPPRPPRNHLEADELVTLLEAADLIGQGLTPERIRNARLANQLRAEGRTWTEIAAVMNCAQPTAIYRARLTPRPDAPRRRRAMIATLALTGARASEHTALIWDRVDQTHGRIVLDDSKTAAGIREIHLSPFVREELRLYKESLTTEPTGDSPVFPVRSGGPDGRHNLLRRLAHVVTLANDLRMEQKLAALPKRITPHTFRRTFITLSFQAGKDLVFVQSQAGHADWKTTLEIYTQQSSRSVRDDVRQLLNVLLGEGMTPADVDARGELHTRNEIRS